METLLLLLSFAVILVIRFRFCFSLYVCVITMAHCFRNQQEQKKFLFDPDIFIF